MSSPIFSFFLLIPLFYLLSIFADFVVLKIKILADKLGLGLGAIGAVLGLLTTLPEMSVGFNSIALGQPELSIGNLIGGLIVILCFVLGLSIILNREIKTDGKVFGLFPFLLFLLSPVLLATKGNLGFWDGILIIGFYLLILRYKFIGNSSEDNKFRIFKFEILYAWKEFVHVAAGIFAVIIVSNLLVRVGVNIIGVLEIPSFLMGVMVFSLGTNLPEIIIMIKSWRLGAGELSLSHLLGSAAANVLVLGVIVIIKRVDIALVNSFYFTLISLSVILLSFLYFYKSGKEFSRNEGYILVSYYLIFLIGESIFS